MSDLEGTHQQVLMVARILLGLNPDALDALLNEYSRMDALMPIMDPTGYRKIMDNIPQHRTVTAAIAGARREIVKVLGENYDP